MNYVSEFARLVSEVTKFNENISRRSTDLDIDFSRAIVKVLNDAEGNAIDTFIETGRSDKITGDSRTEEENEDFYRIAYGTIPSTPDFDTSAIIRFFFTTLGYKY